MALNGSPNYALVGLDLSTLLCSPSVCGFQFVVYKNNTEGPDLLTEVHDGLAGQNPDPLAVDSQVRIVYKTLVHHYGDSPFENSTSAYDFYHQNDWVLCADSYPARCVTGTKRVVAFYHLNPGLGSENVYAGEHAMTYRTGRFDRLGRGWLGFFRVTDFYLGSSLGGQNFANATRAKSVDVNNLLYDADHKWYPRAGMHYREQTVVGEVGRINGRCQASSSENYDWRTFGDSYHGLEDCQGFCPTYFAYPVRHEEHFAQDMDCMTDLVAPSYSPLVTWHWEDQYGNATSVWRAMDDVETDTNYELTYDPNGWAALTKRSTSTCSFNPDQYACRSMVEEFDPSTGVPTSTIIESNDPAHRLTTTYEHDAYGHITGQRQSGVATRDGLMQNRLSCTGYEDIEYIFPFVHRAAGDGVSERTWYEKYDPLLGTRTQLKDINSLVTRWGFDAFGNETREQRADGTVKTTQRFMAQDGSPNGGDRALHVRTMITGGDDPTQMNDLEVQFDTLGRPERSWHYVPAAGGPKRVVEEVQYDDLGLIKARSVPMWDQATHPFVTFTHDDWGRLTSRKAVDGALTTYTYSNLSTDINENGRITHIERDGLGRVLSSKDPNQKVTTYAYGPFDALYKISDPSDASDPAGPGHHTRTILSDAYGRPTQVNDPDTGVTTYGYNAFGELVSQIDANQAPNGWSTELQYDGLGRRIVRTDQDGVTSWGWDTSSGAGIGKLGYTYASSGWSTDYQYDSLGRLTKKATIDPLGEHVYVVGFHYDPKTGLLNQLDYPTWTDGVTFFDEPFAVKHGYDGKGNLTKVYDGSRSADPVSPTVFWNLVGADPVGRIATEDFGDGTRTARVFDDKQDGVLRSILTMHGSTSVQNLEYGYDNHRNLISRTDKLQASSANEERFCYDDLNRLIGRSIAPVNPCVFPVYSYSDDGNILTKAELAGSYAYYTQSPHAVRGVANYHFDYDAKGNQIWADDGSTGRQVSYTAFDKPSTIWRGEATASFAYDADQNRLFKSLDSGDSAPTETVYIDDLFERVTSCHVNDDCHDRTESLVDYKYFVRSPERVVAVVTKHTRPGWADVTRSDTKYVHTDHLGSVNVVTDPAASTFVQEQRSYDPFGQRQNTVGTRTVPQDYTGHESDDELGLVDMKGRMYDPIVGRFLRADPVVRDPFNGQSWNPYSYVRNNPLTLVDPTGFDEDYPSYEGRPDVTHRRTETPTRKRCGTGPTCNQSGGPSNQPNTSTDRTKSSSETTDSGLGGTAPGKPEHISQTAPGFSGSHGGPGSMGGPGAQTASADTGGAIGSGAEGAGRGRDMYGAPPPPAPGFVTLQTKIDPSKRTWADKVFCSVTGSCPLYQQQTFLRRLDGSLEPVSIGIVPAVGPAAPEAVIGEVAEGATSGSYVYQLVDEAGDAVYYGISNEPARRLAEHALDGVIPFNGMQVISEAEPLAQAQALETSLIQQANAEGRTIYNVVPQSISPLAPVQVPQTVVPSQTLLNPKLYPH